VEEPYRSVYPYTQVALERQLNLVTLARDIEARYVAGAVVECGVLDGGTAALMAWATRSRPVHLFDSWKGLPDTSKKDGAAARKWANDVVGSPRRVVSVMRQLSIDPKRLHFHRGWFSETFPGADVAQVALLHIDADFYDSVRLSLEHWFPRLTLGAYVQIDDYSSFAGCRRAVDEFLAKHPNVALQTAGRHAFAYYFKVDQ
jgi:O-methyltransferase